MNVIEQSSSVRVVRVWDLPTRLVHWSFVIVMIMAWWTARNHQMNYHLIAGYLLAWLVLFRIYLGFFGASTSRFRSFVQGPSAILAYVGGLSKKNSPARVGHSPLGALSVLLLLTMMLIQASLGMFAVDVDGIESGPLSQFVSFETGRAVAKLHHTTANVLWVLVGIHLSAIAFYLFYKRQNLVGRMVRGRMLADHSEVEPTFAPVLQLLVGAVLAAAIVWSISTGFQF